MTEIAAAFIIGASILIAGGGHRHQAVVWFLTGIALCLAATALPLIFPTGPSCPAIMPVGQ